MSVCVNKSSVKERVLEGLSVPLAQLVEDEDFASSTTAEAHVGVKHVDVPHEGRINISCINLLKVANVDVESLDCTEDGALVEYYLLSVRQELCMPAEEAHSADFTRHLDSHEGNWQCADPRAGEEAREESKGSIVAHLPHDDVFRIR